MHRQDANAQRGVVGKRRLVEKETPQWFEVRAKIDVHGRSEAGPFGDGSTPKNTGRKVPQLGAIDARDLRRGNDDQSVGFVKRLRLEQ
jgi:hypothetical protein